MRRLIVPSSLSFLAASLCALVMLSPAGAAVNMPHILCAVGPAPNAAPCCPVPVGGPVPCCPVASPITNATTSSPRFVPCCPPSGTCCQPTTCCPPSGTCCQPTACCAPAGCCISPCTPGALTISASPDPSTAGQEVVISGALTATPTASGAKVALWRERSGQSTFTQIAQATTNSAGQYTFTLKGGMVDADQQWYVTANGLTSATLTQHVVALVGLTGRRTVAVGQAMLLHGHVTPSHAGQVVLLEQRHGSHWTVIARPRLGRSSSYGVTHRFTRSGTIDLRAVLPGDVRNDQSDSPIFAVTVRP